MNCKNVICHLANHNIEACFTCGDLTEHIHSIPDPNQMDRIDVPDWRICKPCHEDILRIMGGEKPQRFNQITLTKKDDHDER